MPVKFIKPIDGHTLIGIWTIAEEASYFRKELDGFKPDRACLSRITFEDKVRQSGGSRMLVHAFSEILGFEYAGIEKEEEKAPRLSGHRAANISLSHTHGYSAAIISKRHQVGIDIEAVSEKMGRVKDRFLSEEELRRAGEDLFTLTAFWCAKEVAFKIFHQHHLFFKRDISIEGYDLIDAQTLTVKVHHPQITAWLDMRMESWDDKILVYSVWNQEL